MSNRLIWQIRCGQPLMIQAAASKGSGDTRSSRNPGEAGEDLDTDAIVQCRSILLQTILHHDRVRPSGESSPSHVQDLSRVPLFSFANVYALSSTQYPSRGELYQQKLARDCAALVSSVLTDFFAWRMLKIHDSSMPFPSGSA